METIFCQNYEEDFIFYFQFKEGHLPSSPWRLVFRTHVGTHESKESFAASFDGTLYEHCHPLRDTADTLIVEFKDYGLPPGTLYYKFAYTVPNALFTEKQQRKVLPHPTNWKLWEGATDGETAPVVSVVLEQLLHPATHPATMIVEDADHRFTTDTEREKLDGIEEGANNYTHPNTPDMRHVTDTEKAKWNAKAEKTEASAAAKGLMSAADKSKLDGVEAGANDYSHPATHPASMIEQDETHRFATDVKQAVWDAKPTQEEMTSAVSGAIAQERVIWQAGDRDALAAAMTHAERLVADLVSSSPAALDTLKELSDALGGNPNFATDVMAAIGEKVAKVEGKGLSTEDYTTDEKAKLAGIAPNANNYQHPNDKDKRHVTDIEKAGWSAKAETSEASAAAKGLMSVADKKKLDGISAGANYYTHPTTHPAEMIEQDETHRFATDTERAAWSAKAETDEASSVAKGLMSAEDKEKLDDIEAGANNYTHPNTPTVRHITDEERDEWNAKAETHPATASVAGLMSSTDKAKLDGIATGATNYQHPNTHPASMITEDTTHRFITDAERGAFSAKAEKTEASAAAKGLMSAADKSKLDGVEAGANDYSHPATHPAAMIEQDATHRFATDVKQTAWDAKPTQEAMTSAVSGAIAQERVIWQAGDRDALAAAKRHAEELVANLVNNSPEALDTLKELSDALGGNPNFATDVMNAIGEKVAKVAGKGLSTEDYTTGEKSKLAGIAPNANDYQHPNDPNTRHVTDTEKVGWNSKAAGNHSHDYIPATASCNKNWRWSQQEGQPPYVWGGVEPTTMYLYDPSNFRVSHAQTSDNAAKLGGVAPLGYARAYSSSVDFGGDVTDITTADFVKRLSEMGAFAQPYWMARGSWNYAHNRTISDTGIGRIPLAGALVEVAGDVNCYTIRITTPTTSMGGENRRVFIYINNGQEYFPGWFKLANHEIATSGADGLMSAGDKAKLDGFVPGDIFAALLDGIPKTVYGMGGLQYYNMSDNEGVEPTLPQNPTPSWWHHLVMNHPNAGGFYVDLAFGFYDSRIMIRRVADGAGSNWVDLWTSANFNPDTKAAANHTHAGLMSDADMVKINNLPASAMKSLDVTEAPVSLTVEGGKSYHFNGAALAVLDSSKFTPSADTCMITVPGKTSVAFGNGFRKIAGFNNVVASSSQRQVFVIQQIPLSGDQYARAVTRGVYD